MQALHITPPVASGDLRLTDMPMPEPGPGQVRVRLHAAALNHRDLYLIAGARTPASHAFTPGSDGAGVIDAVGPDVRERTVGDEVLIFPTLHWGEREVAPGPTFDILGGSTDGTLAEYLVLPATNVYPKPAHLSWEEAAALPLSGLTAYRALMTRARLQAGETVLIHGIGGATALAALQIAVAAGARAIVTSSNDAKLERARSLGATVGINYHNEEWLSAVRKATDGRGADVVFESAGEATFPGSVTVTAPGGRIVTFSTTTGGMPMLDLRELFWKQASILGTTMGSPRDFAALLDFATAHHVTPVIDRVFPLADVAAAFTRLAAGEQFGNIVLSIS